MAAWPTAYTFAYLRIAGRVAAPVARLASEPQAGSPLAGRVSHTLDACRSSSMMSRPARAGDVVGILYAIAFFCGSY